MIKEKQGLNYNENIILSNGELDKLQRVVNDTEEWKTLVAKDDEPTFSESHDTTKEVVKTIPEMTPWGEMYEDFDIAKVTPISKVEEYIIQLNKEIEATIVNKKIYIEKKIVEDYVLKLLITTQIVLFYTLINTGLKHFLCSNHPN